MILIKWENLEKHCEYVRLRRYAPLVFAAVLSAVVVSLYLFFGTPETGWMHPTLSAEDQRRAIAECRMEATRASGTILPQDRSHEIASYTKDCLIQKGLVCEKARESDGNE
jgi:hypothetical protein